MFVALALSASLGAGLTLWQEGRGVRIELQASLAAAVNVVQQAEERGPQPPSRLASLFDGDRHLVATVESRGRILARSTLFTRNTRPPSWLVLMLDPHLAGVLLPLKDGDAIRLTPDPVNEVGEAWTDLTVDLAVALVFTLSATVLVLFAVSRALRPLQDVVAALKRVEAADFAARVAPDGPPEVAALARGFNAVADRLALADDDNRRLQLALVRTQEEERAEFARDLHDEIGPYLFAIGIDAAAVRDLARTAGQAAITERAGLIQSAVTHMQQRVRDMLARLRPIRSVELGLAPAMDNLVAFWRARRPAIQFDVHCDLGEEIDFPIPVREAFYLVVQEAISNAVRHADPSRVVVELGRAGPDAFARVSDDGRGAGDGEAPGGYGLMGMGERMQALDGVLSAGPGLDGRGWTVEARAPLAVLPVGALETT